MSFRYCARCDIYGDFPSRFCNPCAQHVVAQPCPGCVAAQRYLDGGLTLSEFESVMNPVAGKWTIEVRSFCDEKVPK